MMMFSPDYAAAMEFYRPDEADRRQLEQCLEEWFNDEMAQREYQSWLVVLQEQQGSR
jgi:hypothetical protein